ncbi:MAG TPA: polyhydroxyalkanoate synthesis regulator DNA-binding domain-containing protein [Polyangiaceae bacterium]|nr:polyhydroxyalkanoate synthesis regulator DNA-binding domain-containing protein [Polyangiaceae bacterium]
MKPSTDRARRVIKRYSNRKLYDTRDSRYVTLLQIAGMVRAGEDVQIIDNASKEDKTEVTLALIISEELKSQPRGVPLGTLRDLIHQRGEKLLTQLREGPIGRLIPGGEGKEELMGEPESAEAADSLEGAQGEGTPSSGLVQPATAEGTRSDLSSFEHWRQTLDERIRMILPSFVGFRDLQNKVDTLTKKVAELEAEVARKGRDG